MLTINENLALMLEKLKKDNQSVETFFLIPSGLLRGKFVDYNSGKEIVILSDCQLSGIQAGKQMTIWVGIINGWGN